jgi:hypothetical protein
MMKTGRSPPGSKVTGAKESESQAHAPYAEALSSRTLRRASSTGGKTTITKT